MNGNRRAFLRQTGLALGLGTGLTWKLPAADERPNFLIILTDDQRADTFTPEFMPNTSALFETGVRFERGFVTTPLCAPCRSSLLTGKLGRNTGVLDNGTLIQETIFPEHLRDSGYFTGLVGKFLNPWNGSPWPGFDYWVAHPGGGSPYFNFSLNENGTVVRYTNSYITTVLRDRALTFLEQASKRHPDQPFLLYFAPNAPHAEFHTPPDIDPELYADLPAHRPPSFNEEDVSDKPAWVQRLTPMPPAQIDAVDLRRRQQLQMILPVDEAVGEIVTLLDAQGRLDNTCIFFMGDNGFFWGEHRIRMGKNRVYEEAQRVPFAIRYPALFNPSVENRLVANIDIAPTIYELAGIAQPGDVDGISMLGLQNGSAWRSSLLFEAVPDPPYQAVRTEQFVFVDNQGDTPEFYDLNEDPYQLDNLFVTDPGRVIPLAAELRARLAARP